MTFKSLQSGLTGKSLIGYAFSLCCDAERHALLASTSESYLCYKAALGIFECVFGSKHPLVGEIQTALRAAKAPACRLDFAAERLAKMIERQCLLFEGSRVECSLQFLAQLYCKKQQFERAIPLLELLLSLQDSTKYDANPNNVDTLNLLSQCYERTGRHAEGFRARQQSCTVRQEGLSSCG